MQSLPCETEGFFRTRQASNQTAIGKFIVQLKKNIGRQQMTVSNVIPINSFTSRLCKWQAWSWCRSRFISVWCATSLLLVSPPIYPFINKFLFKEFSISQFRGKRLASSFPVAAATSNATAEEPFWLLLVCLEAGIFRTICLRITNLMIYVHPDTAVSSTVTVKAYGNLISLSIILN